MPLLIILIILAVSGFIASALLHILSLTQLYEPTKMASLLINSGGFILVYMAAFISKRKCSQANRQELFNSCPTWISTGVGVFVLYAIVGLVHYAIHRYSGGSASPSEKGGFQGFTGHWMALYAVAFLICYSCKKYVELNDSGPEDNCRQV